MKKIHIAAITAAIAIMLGGCGSSQESKFDFTMPAQPTEFVTSIVTDSTDDSKSYPSIEFDGKTYVIYGTLEGEIEQSDLGSCLGYLVQDGQKLEDIGIFSLASDPDMNYLLSMDKQGIMEHPSFFRNAETVGQDIPTPSFITSNDSDYWK